MAQSSVSEKQPIVLLIHGGAGTITKKNMTPEREKEYLRILDQALTKGYAVLDSGGTAMDAIQTAIMIMEDSPLFNAGKGSVYTSDGTIEMDAAVMNGANGMAGSVAGVKRVKNPVTAARKVMEESEHVMMVGEGAEKFAKEKGCLMEDTSYFETPFRKEQLERLQKEEKIKLDHDSDQGNNMDTSLDKKFGTVGAVALDSHGNLAAGTSTGGMTNKKYGRVGDAPIIGAGTYAENGCVAVSCTGHGEFFIRDVVGYDLCAKMKYSGLSVQEASGQIILNELEKKGGKGGLIAVSSTGEYAMPFNTEGMYRGVVSSASKGIPEVKIYKE